MVILYYERIHLKNLFGFLSCRFKYTIFMLYIELYGNTNWHTLTKSLGIPDLLESIHSTGIQSIASFRNAPSDPKVSEP